MQNVKYLNFKLLFFVLRFAFYALIICVICAVRICGLLLNYHLNMVFKRR